MRKAKEVDSFMLGNQLVVLILFMTLAGFGEPLAGKRLLTAEKDSFPVFTGVGRGDLTGEIRMILTLLSWLTLWIMVRVPTTYTEILQ